MRAVQDLRELLRLTGFRRLFTVRVVSQAGDGMFQVGLATLFFFSPERMATAHDVAVAFIVLLVPFTVVGPFAGPLLDRWRRRQVLLNGNATRATLTIVLAWLIAHGTNPSVYVLTLVVLGVNRFLLAALSAGQPKVVPRDQLLVANALTPTLGAVAAVIGAAAGVLVGRLSPDQHQTVVLLLAATLFATSSALATRLGADQLGPDQPQGGLARAVRATLVDLAAAARHLTARRTPGAAIAAMGLQRLVLGVNTLALILISRNILNDPTDADAGLATFATLTALSFIGNGAAILITPLLADRVPPVRWISIGLTATAVGQATLAVSPGRPWVAAAGMLTGMGVQATKIAADTLVQRDTADEFRGRAFSFYDMVYNAAFVAAAGAAATVLPDDGWSRPLLLTLTLTVVGAAALSRLVPLRALDVEGKAGDATSDRLLGGER
jgi:MFS family permease